MTVDPNLVELARLGRVIEGLRAELAHAADEIDQLRTRRDELLAAMVRLTNETPYADEIEGWQGQRAKLIAEVGTLRADRADLARLLRLAQDERDAAEERLEAVDPTYRRDETRQGQRSIAALRLALTEALDGWDADRDIEGGEPCDRSLEMRKLVTP